MVLSSATAVPLTPPPAPPPMSLMSLRLQTAQLRANYVRQFQAASADLKSAVRADVAQLFANGAAPTAQQMANFNAQLAGAVDATAFRLSSQAALLPNSSARLVPAIQNSLLGSAPNTLVSRMNALVNSSAVNGSAQTLQSALVTQINRASLQNTAQVRNFFNTAALNRASVNSSGQRIPLAQFMGQQVVNQVGNTFGTLAQSFPVVANSMLFPNEVTTASPTQELFQEFGLQLRNALSTAQFQLSSDMALFPGSSAVTQRIQPAIFGSPTSTTSLMAALQNLPFGSSNFNSAAATTFNTAFQNVITPINTFFRNATQSNVTLPTSGFTSPFMSTFTGSTFNSGFNNGFATGTNPGFIGFGTAPTTFNAEFGNGFQNLIDNLPTTSGPLGTTGQVGGVPIQTR
jgi:hypothetical protein